jgi:hypothetical protein
MRELTCPAVGYKNGVWCSPFALVLATDVLPKDNGHTESRRFGLTDYFGIEWTSGVLGWRLRGFVRPLGYNKD